MSLGPQFRRESIGLPAGTPMVRGEIRSIVPTPEVPDPSADPARALQQHISGAWGVAPHLRTHPTHVNRVGESVGVHWTRESDTGWTGANESRGWIESEMGKPQTGVPMGKEEGRLIRLNYIAESLHDRSSKRSRNLREFAERETEDRRMFRDLSGDGQAADTDGNPSPSAGSPFTAMILWRGQHDPESVGEEDEGSSWKEREVIYRPDSRLKIVGADVHIARPGETIANPWTRGVFQTVQFDKPMSVVVGNTSYSSRVDSQVRKNRAGM